MRTADIRTGAAVNAEFNLTHLAVSWDAQAGTPGVRLRSGRRWADWHAPHSDHRGKDGVTTDRSYALLPAPGATGYEVDGTVAHDLQVVEMNTASGPIATDASTTDLRFDGTKNSFRCLSRAAWGADESLRFNPDGSLAWGPTQYIPLQALAVHHTAGMNDDPDPAATVRAIYHFDTVVQDFGDYGYHLLIDEGGPVYEGRWSGDDRIPVYGPDLGPDGRRPGGHRGSHSRLEQRHRGRGPAG